MEKQELKISKEFYNIVNKLNFISYDMLNENFISSFYMYIDYIKEKKEHDKLFKGCNIPFKNKYDKLLSKEQIEVCEAFLPYRITILNSIVSNPTLVNMNLNISNN